MSDGATILIAAVIIVPILVLLIYAAFRNFFNSARNLKAAIEGELGRRKPDARPGAEAGPSEEGGKQATLSPG